MNLTADQKNIFLKTGILHLKSLIARKNLRPVQDKIQSELKRLNLKGPSSFAPSKYQNLPFFQQINQISQMLQVETELEKLFHENLLPIMPQLLGLPAKKSLPRAQLLLSFSHKMPWSLQNLNWHLDLSLPQKDEVPGVQAFVLIEDVAPRGGGTLALAGSHKLPYAMSKPPQSALSFLKGHPIFKNLFTNAATHPEELLQPHDVNGISIHLLEMHGKAGDVFLMDMRVLHSPSINVSQKIRLMATCRLME